MPSRGRSASFPVTFTTCPVFTRWSAKDGAFSPTPMGITTSSRFRSSIAGRRPRPALSPFPKTTSIPSKRSACICRKHCPMGSYRSAGGCRGIGSSRGHGSRSWPPARSSWRGSPTRHATSSSSRPGTSVLFSFREHPSTPRGWPSSTTSPTNADSGAAGRCPRRPITTRSSRPSCRAGRLNTKKSASTDDRPFFFQTVSLFGKVDPEYFATLSNNEHAVALLRMLLWMVSGLALLFFFLPFALAGRIKRTPDLWYGSGYFLCIGLGFMLVEVPWMQRFVLYLGHPSYATTVVLATLLLGAGLGSFAAARVEAKTVRRVVISLPVVVSALLLGPAGFAMGFPFPIGMHAFGDQPGAWFWAVNGAASVLATVFSLAA